MISPRPRPDLIISHSGYFDRAPLLTYPIDPTLMTLTAEYSKHEPRQYFPPQSNTRKDASPSLEHTTQLCSLAHETFPTLNLANAWN